MEVMAASLHRLVVNAKLLQNVNSVGAEFHSSMGGLVMFSSDPTTMVTDLAPWVVAPSGVASWFWLPSELKEWDLFLREKTDDDVIDLAAVVASLRDPTGDYQIDTYLDLLDRRQ